MRGQFAEGEGTELRSRLTEGEGTSDVFEIRVSEGGASPRPTIPADLATCGQCLAEILDPSERRYHYPFTNCTNCGPRWSIIERLPYDRPRTSMAGFAMCPSCRAEYEDPTDRRFHAQPIACPQCGPSLELEYGDLAPFSDERLDVASITTIRTKNGDQSPHSQDALDAAAEVLLLGRIVALKGLGGFQLLVDATNAKAVRLLRERKRRPDRPLAVMAGTLDEICQFCEVSEEEARLLSSHEAPIVLLRRRVLSSRPSHLPPVSSVAPGNPYLGVMLPYTPLHHLLLAAVGRPLVCTSGNLSEEPMATTIEDARRRLGPIADAILTHNRPIVRPVDDSVVRVGVDGPQVLRRARGYAPLPIDIQVGRERSPTVLAVGGHLKNTVALALGGAQTSKLPTQVVLSSHVGDLDDLQSVGVFQRAIEDLVGFFEATPEAVACDLHPDYASTRHAERLAEQWDVPLVRVQHHHAHVAACMAEHGLSGPVLGFAWDGTGFGPDGTIWGGEVLVCEGPEFRRVGHLRTFSLPGGEAAVRQPRRTALGLLYEAFGSEATQHAGKWFDVGDLNVLLSVLERNINSPHTSSMGRLFDGVAALCGLSPTISFEGQAAMELEYVADVKERTTYPITIGNESGVLVLDWLLLLRAVLADRAAGVPISIISARFHNALADAALGVARTVAAVEWPIVLTGGCFQNALLSARVRSRLSAAGFSVYNHRKVPPGDGGIALGQAFLALQQL